MSKRRRPGRGRVERNTRSGVSGARSPAPIDLIHRYATPVEVFGSFPKEDPSLQWLRDADQETVVRQVAFWLGKFDEVGLSGWKEVERNWVSETIAEPLRSRLLGLLRGDWMLVSPQSLMIAAKRALTTGHPSQVTDMRPLFMAAVSIQGGLGIDRDPDWDAASQRLAMLTEIIRSAAFHRRPDWGTRIAQSKIRWLDIPGNEVGESPIAVAESFEQVTGVSVLDLQSIGFLLFAQALEHPGANSSVAGLAADIHWERDRLDRVLDLMSASMSDLAHAIRIEEQKYGEDWSFEAFRQFPVVRLDSDRILVLSPDLILERTLGWLPFFDMTQPDRPSKSTAAVAERAKRPFRKICEREVIESLAANLKAGRKHGRLFDGAALRAAYPTGQIADAAVAYRDEWVVIEVSSGQLKRDTVVGGFEEALDSDLARLIDEKVQQIEATIDHIRSDPTRLANDTRRRRRFVPVLVIAEGVPLNPLTHVTITERLAAAGRLVGADVDPLHILDTEDLYVAETIAETDRLGLNELLKRHRGAGLMRRVDLRSWLLSLRSLRKVRADRLNATLDAAMDLITDNLGMDRDAVQIARTERRDASSAPRK